MRLDLSPALLAAACGCLLSAACAEDGAADGAGGETTDSEAESDDRPGGGETNGDTCRDASACDEPPGDCAWAVCVEGACGVAFADDGAPAASQVAGDCRRIVCDGAGGTRTLADEEDVPRTDDTCTAARCDGEEIVVTFEPPGTLCGEAGLLTCDGEGRCVGCDAAADCGADAACFTRTCDEGTCGVEPADAGTVAADPSPGDCREDVCDGSGSVVEGAPAEDPPAEDDDACDGVLCRDGVVVETFAAEDTPCSTGGSCDGAGSCVVGCRADAECGADTPCRDVSCDVATGACLEARAPAGQVVADVDSGDCRVTVCDGAGGEVDWPDDAETPTFDGEECTRDVCEGGVPHPFALAGTPCTSGACDSDGTCVVRPFVLTTAPYDTEELQSPLDPVVVTFSEAMDPSTLTAPSDPMSSACSGTIQLSEDGFASCLPVILTVDADGLVARAVPAPALSHGRRLQLRVTGDARSVDGRPLLRPFAMESGWTTSLDRGAYDLDGSVVVAEVFSGAGQPGAALTRDHVVLHNRGNEPVSLGGWSLQSLRVDGAWDVVALEGDLAPGGHLRVGLAGDVADAADVEADVSLDGARGAVALVTHAQALPTDGCPDGDDAVADLVGWGSSGCASGSALSPIPPARAAARAGRGCVDAGDDATDFVVEEPFALGSTDEAWLCQPPGVLNETGAANEIDRCALASDAIAAAPGASLEVQLTVLEERPAGALLVEVGVGPRASNPGTQSEAWTWSVAVPAGSGPDGLQFRGTTTAPSGAARGFAARVSHDGGASFTYCDADGAGADDGLTFDVAQVGALTDP